MKNAIEIFSNLTANIMTNKVSLSYCCYVCQMSLKKKNPSAILHHSRAMFKSKLIIEN